MKTNTTGEIFFRKTKKGYEAYDRAGRKATGITKQIAENQYYLLYGVSREPITYKNEDALKGVWNDTNN